MVMMHAHNLEYDLFQKDLKVTRCRYLFTRTHLSATERHLPYGITQCYMPPDRYERAPPESQPCRKAELTWLVIYRDGLSVQRHVYPRTGI